MTLMGNKEIYLTAGFNEPYLKKAETYLETVNKNSNVNNVIITLDFDVSPEIRKKYSSIKFIKILSSQVKSPNSNTCMQHGAFLSALNFVKDDAIIIFTDTDIVMQCPFNEANLVFLRSCENGHVYVNYNVTSRNKEKTILLDDVENCQPTVDPNLIISKYPEISKFSLYNTGVIIANYKTYKELYEKYNSYWPEFAPLFDSYIKQQWLLSYIIQKHFTPRDLPYSIHCNAYSLPMVSSSETKRWCFIGESSSVGFKFCIGSDVVVFNHHIIHKSKFEIRNLKKIIKRLTIAIIVLAFVCVSLIFMIFNHQ